MYRRNSYLNSDFFDWLKLLTIFCFIPDSEQEHCPGCGNE
jgi:hypothetical protein